MTSSNRWRWTWLVAGASAALLTWGTTTLADSGPSIARGYDLFRTPDGSSMGVTVPSLGLGDVSAGEQKVTLMRFRGVPLRSFDFGADIGRKDVGAADTIVRRLDVATPGDSLVRVELVALLLESTNVPGYFVTLQSSRLPGDVPSPALGLPSTGTLDIGFGLDGASGWLTSDLWVNYDVRQGSPTGPIVLSGTTGTGFTAEDLVWRQGTNPGTCTICGTDTCTSFKPCPFTIICHDAAGLGHEHCTIYDEARIPLIEGVNHKLNGRNAAADFHVSGPPDG